MKNYSLKSTVVEEGPAKEFEMIQDKIQIPQNTNVAQTRIEDDIAEIFDDDMYLKDPPRKISDDTKRMEDKPVSENKALTLDNLSHR